MSDTICWNSKGTRDDQGVLQRRVAFAPWGAAVAITRTLEEMSAKERIASPERVTYRLSCPALSASSRDIRRGTCRDTTVLTASRPRYRHGRFREAALRTRSLLDGEHLVERVVRVAEVVEERPAGVGESGHRALGVPDGHEAAAGVPVLRVVRVEGRDLLL